MSLSKIASLFPEEVIHHLIQIGDTERPRRFEIGDIRNLLAAFVHEYKPIIELDEGGTRNISLVDVDLTIEMLLKHEFSVRSIQRYALVAECIPLTIREKYDQLPFSHFDLARQFGENLEDVLKLSMSQFAMWGRPPSREALLAIAEFSFGGGEKDIEDDEEGDEPEIRNGIGSIMSFANSLRKFIDHKLNAIPAGKQSRIKHLAEELLEELDEIMQPVL